MPEGDTIYRSAVNLRKVMEGEAITGAACHNPRFERPLPTARLVDQPCSRVEARGKHLLMHLGSGEAIHSHMGMTGSWHVYGQDQRWSKGKPLASLELKLGNWSVVCFTPKRLELLTTDQLRQHPHLNRLGPDLLDEPFDIEAALSRFRQRNDLPLGQAVMDQTLVSGIGNVYKSEVLFLESLNPFTQVGNLDDLQLRELINRARKLMLRNLMGHVRKTRFDGGSRKWVYNRSGEPCPKCGEVIQMQRQGDMGRSTYWCPVCQPK
ncbi:Fpg/Nei family DNA glycosylase [Adhaeretor mobilis]|uniref:DNA-(apurinic or apyrimidinic site) lyase n=1 Tax=Adhaeretor mobilis TaxID=1930276 RepID=A0A517MZM7_9BACT|nr:DNA-formamidopyrimidine glycosylase family protein [Adhaeretor mobilis]QDT00339.1 Endonuclease 8 [Adhaeretor mobilis]